MSSLNSIEMSNILINLAFLISKLSVSAPQHWNWQKCIGIFQCHSHPSAFLSSLLLFLPLPSFKLLFLDCSPSSPPDSTSLVLSPPPRLLSFRLLSICSAVSSWVAFNELFDERLSLAGRRDGGVWGWRRGYSWFCVRTLSLLHLFFTFVPSSCFPSTVTSLLHPSIMLSSLLPVLPSLWILLSPFLSIASFPHFPLLSSTLFLFLTWPDLPLFCFLLFTSH